MPKILSLSSQVAHGHVGHSATVFVWQRLGIDVIALPTIILSNHSEYDNAYTKARLIAAKREVGEEHPFVVGAAGVQRYFTVMTECATASKLRVGAK